MLVKHPAPGDGEVGDPLPDRHDLTSREGAVGVEEQLGELFGERGGIQRAAPAARTTTAAVVVTSAVAPVPTITVAAVVLVAAVAISVGIGLVGSDRALRSVNQRIPLTPTRRWQDHR